MGKCIICGNETFLGHQVCYLDVIVDGNNNFQENYGGSADKAIYEHETPYGDYTCQKCGAEYSSLPPTLQSRIPGAPSNPYKVGDYIMTVHDKVHGKIVEIIQDDNGFDRISIQVGKTVREGFFAYELDFIPSVKAWKYYSTFIYKSPCQAVQDEYKIDPRLRWFPAYIKAESMKDARAMLKKSGALLDKLERTSLSKAIEASDKFDVAVEVTKKGHCISLVDFLGNDQK